MPHSVAIRPKPIGFFLLFTVAAIAGNYANVPLFWGVHALFGSVAVLVAMRFYGAKWGIGVAALSLAASALLIGNLYLMLVLFGEMLVVGLAYRRASRNLVLLDGGFWLLLGMPLIALLQYSMPDGSASAPLVLTLRAGINGVLNALLASLLGQAILLWRWFRSPPDGREQKHSISLRQMLFDLLVASVLMPALLVVALDSRHHHGIVEAGAMTRSLLMLSVITALAFSFGWLLSRWLVNPLIQLAAETNNLRFKLMDTHELELPDSPFGEMENLVRNFRETAQMLHKSFSELYGFTELLEMRVEERTHEFLDANRQLKEEIATRAEQARQLRKTAAELETQKFALDQHSIVAITDAQGIITYANDKFCEVSQYSRAELLGQDHRLLNSGHHPKAFFKEMRAAIGRGQVWKGVIRNRKKDGSFYWVDTTIVPFMDAGGKPYQYVAIRTDITERQRFDEELMRAKEAAEEASRTKSEFLSRMSHELRTPLNAIIGFTQILESGVDGELSEGQRESAAHILQAGWHLLDLISEILDLARIESGRMAMTLEEIDLTQLVGECVDMIMPLANERHILIEDKIAQDEEIYRVRADRTRLKQVMLNLMSNAVKYNATEGTMRLACTRIEGGRLRIDVTDSGIGIPADKIDELFKPFSRLNADKSEIQGAGVGLAVTRSLIELMGGRIGVESEVEKGATFWVELEEEGGGLKV